MRACWMGVVHCASWTVAGGRVDVREEVGGGGLARFADVHHVAGPRVSRLWR